MGSQKQIYQVPYTATESYDFHEDYLQVKQDKIFYDAIEGYSYLLKSVQSSVNLIPTNNTVSFNISFDVGLKKLYKITSSASAAMAFHTARQDEVQQIYAELLAGIDYFLAPKVLEKVLHKYKKEGQVSIGGLDIYPDGLITSGIFKKKVLAATDIGESTMARGVVSILDNQGKSFFSCSLSTMNAPLLPILINRIYR